MENYGIEIDDDLRESIAKHGGVLTVGMLYEMRG